MKRILKVYCGEDVSNFKVKNLTPLQWVQEAKKIVQDDSILSVYSNNQEFCSSLDFLSKKHENLKVEFYWNKEKVSLDNLFDYFDLCYSELDSL